MPPKNKGTAHELDGVPYTVTPAKKGASIVVVGTGVVSNDQRDFFRLSSDSDVPLEDQIRRRAKWESIRAAVHVPNDGASEKSSQAESSATAGCEPATQAMDIDDGDDADDAAERLGLPPSFNLDAACSICEDDESPPAFFFSGERLACCESCVDSCDSGVQRRVAEAARAALEAREKVAQQPQPEPPAELRRSGRATRPVEPVYDLDRSGKGQPAWSAYDRERLNSRHGRTRQETYSELQTARDSLREAYDAARRENSALTEQLDGVFSRLRELIKPRGDDLELTDCEAAAAVVLREAIQVLADELANRSEADGAGTEHAAAPPQESAAAEAQARRTAGQSTVQQQPRFRAHARMNGVDGTCGEIAIDAAFLSWGPLDAASDVPWQHYELQSILYAEIDDADEVSVHQPCTSIVQFWYCVS